MHKVLFVIFLLLGTALQGITAPRDTSLVKAIINHGLCDVKDYALSPIQWDKSDWIILGGVSGISAASMLWFDEPINEFTRHHHTPGLDLFFNKTMEPMGHSYPAIAAAGFAIHGLIKKDNYSMQTAMIAIESYALNGIMVQIVKNTTGRTRPNSEGTAYPFQWEGPFFHGNSFYSGHTSSAFSVASVVAYRYRDTKWVPWVSYGLASIGGLQRIYNNRHWASDVIFGAMVGTATGIFLSKTWEKRPLLIFPHLSTQSNGISLIIPIRQ